LVAQGEQFDVVCSLEVIEHVSDVPAFLHSLTPLVKVGVVLVLCCELERNLIVAFVNYLCELKPGGLLFLSSINRTALSAALAIGAAEYVMRIVPPGTHDWNKFVQPSEIQAELTKDGLTVKDVSGIVGDPVSRNWRVHPTCTDINYIMCATKPQN
jgi:2-polyprenyl-6-hydroxyphenyl methylase/3-demethylubiquinone-9 3-methyltransferase